ncbi:hypothetical protein DAEQUDRAFT_769612 [Daedalea quercina L-15889]|uniref:Uncharacterized protein n=1 Tax=Daedalea quercina L-15889 TaxID=1314783 RepID=A0A165LKZ6_9APHY|nr:hypothetical protein DAEQUDRAFT_769612 [Daedalea quercina L-15889]
MCFNEKFKPQLTNPIPAPSAASSTSAMGINRWRRQQTQPPGPVANPSTSDDIELYLSTPQRLLPPDTTVLQYWNHELTTTPWLAAMGLAC